MFCGLIINGMPELVKFFQQLNLNFYFTKPQVKHLQGFLLAMMFYGYRGKMANVSGFAMNTCRTSVCRFMNSEGWKEEYLLSQMQEHVINRIWAESKETGMPIYVIADDTICEKTVPSSKAEQPISGCGFHRSHLENKTVYGHQFVTVMLRCGSLTLPYDTVLYEKNKDSKIQIASRIIQSLPKPVKKGYVLADSWYTCQELLEASWGRGYHYIGALKSNRKIFPKGYRRKGIQVGEFSRSLKLRDLDLVTINGEAYYTYTYLGRINGAKKVKIVISWPKDAVFVPRAMKAFVSTDICMSTKQLLNHYANRWPIEVYFREGKRQLGMKHCQVRSMKGVKRFQYIVMLGYIFCCSGDDDVAATIGKKQVQYQKEIDKYRLAWVYEQAKSNVDLECIYKELRLA